MSKKKEINKDTSGKAALILVVFLVLVAAGVSLYLLKAQLGNQGQGVEDENQISMVDPTAGRIFFTFMNSDMGDDIEPELSTYIKNFTEQRGVTSNNFSGLSKEGIGMSVNQLSFSPNGEWLTFLAINSNLLEGEPVGGVDGSYAIQVYRAKLDGDSIEEAVSGAEQLTDIQAAHKSIPSINNDGEVLFVSLGVDVNNFNTEITTVPSEWVIHYIDDSGAVTELATGLYPQWLDGDNFMFVSENGLELYSVKNNGIATLIEYKNMGTERFGSLFDISDDKSTLVWSNPSENYIEIMSINREGENITLESSFNLSGISAAWPQLSPDKKYIGFMEGELPMYSIYSVSPFGETYESIDISGFDNNSIFVTDWR